MDYGRIYREFIADRRGREPFLQGYTERHHILPRSLGGGDELDNLIALTAEDHFFAHLLLAKMHDNAAAWGAVMIMHERGRRCDVFKRRARLRYAWARRRYDKFCTEERVGEKNPNFKPETVDLKHLEGTRVCMTRSAIAKDLGIPHAALCGLMSGKSRSYKGWMLPETDPQDTGKNAAGSKKRCQKVYQWQHLSGDEFTGTCHELAAKFGLRQNDVTAVARGAHGICFGWSVAGRKVGWASGRLHFRDERVFRFLHSSGAEFLGTQRGIVGVHGVNQQCVSALIRGKRKSVKGWRLAA